MCAVGWLGMPYQKVSGYVSSANTWTIIIMVCTWQMERVCSFSSPPEVPCFFSRGTPVNQKGSRHSEASLASCRAVSWGCNYTCIQAGKRLPGLPRSAELGLGANWEGGKHPPHRSQLQEFCCLQQRGFPCCGGNTLQPASCVGSWKAPVAQLAAGCPGAVLRQFLCGTAPDERAQPRIQSEWNSALASGISGCNSGGILSGSRDGTGQDVFSGFTWQMDRSE